MKQFLACLTLLGTAAVASAVSPEESRERMKKDIFFLAGPECVGRGVGSAGIDKAADRIAAAFQDAGVWPGNSGGNYFQPFSISGRAKLGTPNTVIVAEKGQPAAELKFNDEYTVLGTSGSGKASGELVFAGYGLTIKTDKLAYDDYAGIDAKGKVVVILRKTPQAEQKGSPFEAATEASSLVAKIENAEKHGAAGIVFVNDRTFGKPDDALMDLRRSGGTVAKVPVLQVKRAKLDKLLAAHGKKLEEVETAIDKDLKPMSMPLAGCTAAAEVTINRDPIACKNVVGILPGSGPLADETIIIGAHYDHLGTSAQGSLAGQAGEGQVHFGADDNASGTTTMIELARRFAAMKNRFGRRIVFIAFSGEERGLLGSIHYAKEPLVPIEKTVFMLNLDMVGRAATVEEDGKKKFRVVVSGVGSSDTFDKLADQVNKRFDFKLMKTAPGSGPSDHQSFYQKKIPVLFVHTGTHKDYHRPTDTPDKIELAGMERIASYSEIIAMHMATVPERPNYLVAPGRWVDPTDTNPRGGRPAMPRLGVMPGNYEDEGKGVLVEDVIKEGAAEAAGVRAGDFIVDIGGKPVKNIDDYMKALAAQKAGVEIEITVMRKTEKKTLKITPKAGN